VDYFHSLCQGSLQPAATQREPWVRGWDIPRCANISDNIWLWSNDKQSHYEQLEQLLTKLESSGLTLKYPKCSFMVPEVNVFGHIISGNGIRPDDAKIKAVSQAPPPKSCSEVRSFLGLTNYCSRCIYLTIVP
jgi:hypothetical protein